MSEELLSTAHFKNASEMDDAIYCLIAILPEDDDYRLPTVLIEDANGNTLNRAKLYEDTLTDGSKVYKIVLGKAGG